MGLSRILAWGAVIATAAAIAASQMQVALSQRATWDCGDGSILSALVFQFLVALPWLLILGAQWIRLRFPATSFLAVVSGVWIAYAGLWAWGFASESYGGGGAPDCLYDDWDSFDAILLEFWLLALPCAAFFVLHTLIAAENSKTRNP